MLKGVATLRGRAASPRSRLGTDAWGHVSARAAALPLRVWAPAAQSVFAELCPGRGGGSTAGRIRTACPTLAPARLWRLATSRGSRSWRLIVRTASPGGRYRPLSKSVPISQVERALSFIALISSQGHFSFLTSLQHIYSLNDFLGLQRDPSVEEIHSYKWPWLDLHRRSHGS